MDRTVIEAVFSTLRDDRKGRVVCAGIVCGTYFKYYNAEGQRLDVRCPLCCEANSLNPIKMHAELGDTSGANDEDALVQYLCALIEVNASKSPAVLVPMPVVEE